MRVNPWFGVIVTLLAFSPACGVSDNLPSQADIDWATDMAGAAVEVAGVAESALQALGILPVYECEEPRATFVSDIADGFIVEHACASAQITAQGEEADALTLSFASGCSVDELELSGRAVFTYAGGEDSMELTADFSQLTVDGRTLPLAVGYGTCGDETSIFASGEGALPEMSGWSYSLDVTVAKRAGMPVFGSTTLLFSGSASLSHPEGTDQLSFDELEYELGGLLPKSGSLTITTASGRVIRVEFSDGFFFGEVEITLDDYDAVSVPLL